MDECSAAVVLFISYPAYLPCCSLCCSEQSMLARRAGRPPLPVHRLDQDTSGVVLFSKHRATCSRVHAEFQQQARGAT